MFRRTIVQAIVALTLSPVLWAFASDAFAQTAPPRVVESSAGDLLVVYGRNLYSLVPDQISDSDLAALNLTGEIDGVLQTREAVSVEVVEATDGTLYVVSGATAWTLIPEAISDSAMAGLTRAGEFHGVFTVPASSPLTGTPPPPQLQGKWMRVRPTEAGGASWIGDTFVFNPDGTFEHAGRFVFGLDIHVFESGVLIVNGPQLRLNVTGCEEQNSQFEQLHPCSDLKRYQFQWRVGNNELGHRVLMLVWPNGSRDEFHPVAR